MKEDGSSWQHLVAALREWAARDKAAAWVSATASAVTATAAIWAAGAYVADLATNVSLSADPPLIVELRCSRADFDPGRCMNSAFDEEAHLSLTAAFRIWADGPARAKAAIDAAAATVRFGNGKGTADPHSGASHELTAFWSANLTPGHEDQQRQVVSLSLTGGESLSREIWFMPIPRLNHDKPAEVSWERAEFYSWRHAFHEIGRRAQLPDKAHLDAEKLVHIDFSVAWRNGSGPARPIVQHCTAELGVSVRMQYEQYERDKAAKATGDPACTEAGQPATSPVAPAATPACKPDPRALSFTLPCREARPRPKAPWYALWR